jgi:RNA polymerase sigma factor (sigma-70 family)
MIAHPKKSPGESVRDDWQAKFLELLPGIKRQLRFAYRRLAPEARDEAVQEGIANCLQAFQRLHEQGRGERAFASSLARFAIRQINSGRQVGCPLNVLDPMSRYAQRAKGIRVEQFKQHQTESGRWVSAIVEDRRARIPDQVAMRIDFPSWMKTLTRRDRAIAKDLALGNSTREVARKYGVSPGRISQMRRELHDSWHDFQGTSTTGQAS